MKNVEKVSITVLISMHIGGYTQERDPTCVLTVVRVLVRVLTYVHITEPTQERNLTGAVTVASASVRALPLINTKRSIHKKSSWHSQCLSKLPRKGLSKCTIKTVLSCFVPSQLREHSSIFAIVYFLCFQI